MIKHNKVHNREAVSAGVARQRLHPATVLLVFCSRTSARHLSVYNVTQNELQANVTVCIFILYRQVPRSGNLPLFTFTQRPKISIFAPHGRLVAAIHVKLLFTWNLSRATVTRVRLVVRNFTWIGVRGWVYTGPKIWKFSLFGTESQSPCMCESLDRYLQVLRAFMRPTTVHKCFKFDAILFTGYGVIGRRSFTQNFPCTR